MKTIDRTLLAIAAVMLSPIVFLGFVPMLLVLGALWPLLVLPVICLDRAFPRGEAPVPEKARRFRTRVRPRLAARHAS
jgi:hypothetical protein